MARSRSLTLTRIWPMRESVGPIGIASPTIILLPVFQRLSYSTPADVLSTFFLRGFHEDTHSRCCICYYLAVGFRLHRMLQTGDQEPTASAHQDGCCACISEQRPAVQDRASLHGSCDERIDSSWPWPASAERTRG